MALIAGLRTQARFFFLLVPRLMTGRFTGRRLGSYAIELTKSGNRRLGRWCLDRAVRSSAHDESMCEAVLELCIRAGYHDAAEQLASRFYDTSGFSPVIAVRLTGDLVLSGRYDAALRNYDRLLKHCGGDIVGRSPAPAPPEPLDEREVRSLLAECARHAPSASPKEADLDLKLARLCFSFSAFDTSARLFERAGRHAAMDALDQIAHAYALLRSGRPDCTASETGRLRAASTAVSADADWQILLATVHFAMGSKEETGRAVDAALRTRFAGHADSERMVEDCRAIIGHLWSCPEVLTFDARISTLVDVSEEGGLRKLFVCGSGWSGSGALYDALSEYDGLAEVPCTPIDRFINVGTDSEMTFVQGPAGLGMIWRTAKQERKLSRLELWDTFRFHVLGGGGIGYNEYKSAKVASNLLVHLGSRYTRPFRQAYEKFASLSESAPLAQVRNVLTEATEALSVTFAKSLTAKHGCGGEFDCILFNNAIFGPNVDMLEIFHNFRAAVVTRDPLDQFADRRAQDIKHWMTANRFALLYRSSHEEFHARRGQLHQDLAREVREIEFERFVLDAAYRQSVIDWLIEGQNVRVVRRRFEPGHSSRNIGIHATLLAPGERAVLENELKQWRRS